MSARRDSAGTAVSRTLTMGVIGSLSLMGAGLILALFRGGTLPVSATPLPDLAGGLLQGDTGAILSLGILILLATPALRVVVLVWQFARRREWLFVAISLTVLGVLALSVAFGRGE